MKYDNQEIKPTTRFINSIEELLRAEIQMMGKHKPLDLGNLYR